MREFDTVILILRDRVRRKIDLMNILRINVLMYDVIAVSKLIYYDFDEQPPGFAALYEI